MVSMIDLVMHHCGPNRIPRAVPRSESISCELALLYEAIEKVLFKHTCKVLHISYNIIVWT